MQLGNDLGSSLVSLLFTVSGSCVLCWMLSLLLYLSPRHKQKPFLTHIATLFYSVVTSILLSQITNASARQYYADTLDIVDLHNSIYQSFSFRIPISISQLLTHLAFFEIVLHLTRPKFRWLSIVFGTILTATYTILQLIFEIKYDDVYAHKVHEEELNLSWRIALVAIKMVIICGVAITLFWYTTYVKNPRKISYSKRVVSIAFLAWFMLVAQLVLLVLSVTYLQKQWLLKYWIIYLPYIVEIFLLTIIWEWIYIMAMLEKRDEISGVLGRRISMDDVTSLNLNLQYPNKKGSLLRGLRKSFTEKKTKKSQQNISIESTSSRLVSSESSDTKTDDRGQIKQLTSRESEEQSQQEFLIRNSIDLGDATSHQEVDYSYDFSDSNSEHD